MNNIDLDNVVVKVVKIIIVILIVVVFGIMGYWQIQLNKNSKKLENIKAEIEKLDRDYEEVRKTYINEINNEVE